MTHFPRKALILVALGGCLAPAPALAQQGQSPATPVAGRNFVGAQIDASTDPYRQLNLLSTRVVDGGKALNVWLDSHPRGCLTDLATAKLPIDAQGHFAGTLVFRGASDEQIGTGTVDGQFKRTPHRGTVAATHVRVRFQSPTACDTGDVRIRAISPKHQPRAAGHPGPNALFVGFTNQRSSRIGVKLPTLALLSSDGTQVKRFLTDANVPCKPSHGNAGGIFRIRDIPIEDNSFAGFTGYQSSVPGSEDKRTLVINAKGTFGDHRLAGTFAAHQVRTDPNGKTTDDCDSGQLPFVAARVK